MRQNRLFKSPRDQYNCDAKDMFCYYYMQTILLPDDRLSPKTILCDILMNLKITHRFFCILAHPNIWVLNSNFCPSFWMIRRQIEGRSNSIQIRSHSRQTIFKGVQKKLFKWQGEEKIARSRSLGNICREGRANNSMFCSQKTKNALTQIKRQPGKKENVFKNILNILDQIMSKMLTFNLFV